MKYLRFIIITILTLFSCNESSQRIKAITLNDNALKAIETKKYSLAIDAAKKALEASRKISDTTEIVKSNYLIARASALSSDFNNAIIYGENASYLCKIFENYPLEYKINNTLSWAYFTQGRGFDENLEHNNRKLFVVDQMDDDNAKAIVYNNYGYDATVSGKVLLKEAIEYMKFANDYYAKIEKNNGRWNTLMNLTWQYRLINNLSKSEEYGRMAVKQAQIDNDRHAIIEANINLGETLLTQNKIRDAKPIYEQALEISKQKDDRDKYVFDVYYSRYLWETGKNDEAIELLKNAVNFLESSEIFYEMQARAFLANYFYLSGRIKEAEQQLIKFKNPRARYFSQEAKVIAASVKAKIVAIKDREKALDIVNQTLQGLDKSGAESLKIRLIELRAQL